MLARRAPVLLLLVVLASGCAPSTVYRAGVPYPGYARAGSERYRVCHKDRNVLTLPAPAVEAHLRHGDHFGSCSRADRRRHDEHYRGNRGRGNSGR